MSSPTFFSQSCVTRKKTARKKLARRNPGDENRASCPPGLCTTIFSPRYLDQRSRVQLKFRCHHQKNLQSDEFKVKSFVKTKEKKSEFFLTAIRRGRYLFLAAESPRRLVQTLSSRGRLMQARPRKDDKKCLKQ